ncbi:protein of unknown function [Paenibacillus alvei]|uniref:Uncharacterized protein n=1 Tax=Paenibacillus alvei TaxID=44250 RepID=A0A383RIU4_PAEAL|nr:protein of unknown function [Paenibacillus alvei]
MIEHTNNSVERESISGIKMNRENDQDKVDYGYGVHRPLQAVSRSIFKLMRCTRKLHP